MKITSANFDSFEWKHGKFLLYYSWDDQFKFTHEIKIHGYTDKLKPKDFPAWRNYVFHLGLARFPFYFAPANPKNLIIKAGKMFDTALHYWGKWYLNGLGEFFYRNKLPMKLKLTNHSELSFPASEKQLSDKVLVLNGGGKDSAVTGEILKGINIPFKWVVLGLNETRKNVIDNSGVAEVVRIQGKSDKRRKRAKRKLENSYSGHQPLSLYLAMLAVTVAELTESKKIVVGNEKSANYPNLKYQGHKINHQYTKSFEFEKEFSEYIRIHLNPDIAYFSLLRPLYELQIVKMFTKFPQYHNHFISCNTGVHKGKWCGKCSKCAFIYLALYPFMPSDQLEKMFKKNLLNSQDLLEMYLSLTGIKGHKPFDCVGTTQESLAAMYLASLKANPPSVVKYFIEGVPQLSQGQKLAESIMANYDEVNLIPQGWKEIVNTTTLKLLE